MKVLIINVVCGIRSTGRICADIADALDADGHTVKILYGRGNVPEKYSKYAVRMGSDLDVALHGAIARLDDGCGFGSAASTRPTVKWIKSYDPDVIHLHNLHGYYINIGVLFDYLRGCEKKIIWTLHDGWPFTGHSAYCDVAGCEKWKTGCGGCPLTREYPASLVDRSARNWKRKKELMTGIPGMSIVTPSDWLAGIVKQSFLSGYPVSVIRNGIDTRLFRPVNTGFRIKYGLQDKFILLGVSTSWDHMKGLDDFMHLSELLDETFQVVLVGLTPEQKKKLPPKVVGIERTDSVDELAGIYTESNLFLNLSYCENYPTVNIEAICCGTPVLTYRTGGSPESVISHGGTVVERGDIEAVAEAVKTIASSTREKQALNVDPSEFDIGSAVAKYLKIMSGCN